MPFTPFTLTGASVGDKVTVCPNKNGTIEYIDTVYRVRLTTGECVTYSSNGKEVYESCAKSPVESWLRVTDSQALPTVAENYAKHSDTAHRGWT